jgi:hypothetical protein
MNAKCLNCGGEYLHPHATWIYTRPEDSPAVHYVGVQTADDCHGVDISTGCENSAESDNPSLRRGGILIDFWCETCGAFGPGTQLRISEHKGTVEIEWRSTKPVGG